MVHFPNVFFFVHSVTSIQEVLVFVNFLHAVLNEDEFVSRKSRDLEYTGGRDQVESLKTKRQENQTH